jgi:hypothetical protein
MVNKYCLIFILLLCMTITVSAVPTTQAATLIGSNNVTLNMVGGAAPTWFEWGQLSSYLSWRTVNSSEASMKVYGSPLLGNTLFYYRACDSTGCGATMSFTTLQITPQPEMTLGISVDNITQSQYDITVIARESIRAYFWAVPDFPTIVWGLLFFGIYIGLWIRERDLVVPVILGLITGSFVMFNDAGLQLGIPVEFQQIAQGLTYAALAGIILSLIKRS